MRSAAETIPCEVQLNVVVHDVGPLIRRYALSHVDAERMCALCRVFPCAEGPVPTLVCRSTRHLSIVCAVFFVPTSLPSPAYILPTKLLFWYMLAL